MIAKIPLFRKNNALRYYLMYTVLFTGISFSLYYFFYINGKSLIWKKDGLFQHYNSLIYFGEYLRSGIKNLSFPLWDFKIGYGADVITTLHYYVLGDPLNLLSVFVPKVYGEWLYLGLVFLRFYLSGVSFSIYSRERGNRSFGVLAGALIYTFCGYALVAGVRHPYFLNPMIYFPLLLLGVERIYAGKKPFLFIMMVFLSAISNFYFFYMLTLLTVLFAAIRFFFIFQKHRLVNLWQQLRRFFLYYITGVLLSCFILLPVIIAMLSGGRLNAGNFVPSMYSGEYYSCFLPSFVYPLWIGNWTIMGYTLVGMVSVLFLWTRRKKHWDIKILFIIMTLLLLLPVGGYVLNGFSYVSNRWVWGYSFIISYIVTLMLPEIVNVWGKKLHRKFFKKRSYGMAIGIIVASIILNIYGKYAPETENYIQEFREIGSANEKLSENETLTVANTGDTDFYRYEEKRYNTEINYNTSLQSGLYGTSFYFSVANGTIFDYFNQTGTNITKSFSYAGLDGRAFTGALASVKYFIVKEGDEAYLPYGYQKVAGVYVDKAGLNYFAYLNQNALPLAYSYDSVIPTETFQKLTPVKKQQAMLQAAVIADGKSGKDVVYLDQNADYEIVLSDGVRKEGNSFIVEDDNAVIALVFQGMPDSENYFCISGLDFKGSSNQDKANIKVRTSDITKTFHIRTPENQWYENTHDFLIHTGYTKDSQTAIEISLSEKGIYTFNQMQVICLPMEELATYTEKLRENVLEKVTINGNEVNGTISLDRKKTLCFSIPYSTGWKAYVDGEAVELKQANIMYMGLELEEGEHTIRLVYETPGLKVGSILSVIGIMIIFLILIHQRFIVKARQLHAL